MASTDLYVNAYDGTWDAWVESGASPYLNNSTSNWIMGYGPPDEIEGWFDFADMPVGSWIINSVTLYMYVNAASCIQKWHPYIHDGSSEHDLGEQTWNGQYTWKTVDVSAILDTTAKIDAAKLRIEHTYKQCGQFGIWKAMLRVDYDPAPLVKSHNWRWYEDDGASPTNPLANENVQPSGWQRGVKVRLRICLHEVNAVAANNQDIDVEYSTDELAWSSLGGQAAVDKKFRYADGQATDGNPLAGGKISCQDELGKYHEQSCVNCENIGASAHHEIDVCIENYSGDHNTVYYFRIIVEGSDIPLDGGATHPQYLTSPAFTPKQGNWRFYEDDGAQPTTPLANQNVGPTGIQRLTKIRLRICIHETAGSPYGTNQDIQVQWSTDDISYFDIGAQGAIDKPFRWADGQAVDGNPIGAALLTCTTSNGKNHEQACVNCEDVPSSAHHEIDICIQNYNATANQMYYFRIWLEGAELTLDGGKVHPRVTTNPRYTLTVQSTPVTGFSFTANGGGHTSNWSAEYESGTVVTLVVATPQTVTGQKYRFLQWEDLSVNPTRNVTINANKTVIFTMLERYTLTVNSSPITGFSFTFDGAPQTSNYSGEVDKGTVVTLVVSTPQTIGGDDYEFKEWEDLSINPTRNVTVNGDQSVTFTMEAVAEGGAGEGLVWIG